MIKLESKFLFTFSNIRSKDLGSIDGDHLSLADMSDCGDEKCFANAWWTMKEDSLGAFNVEAGNEIWVEEWIRYHFKEGFDGAF